MKQIRILLARMPAMLIDILSHVVASEFDMMVAGRIEDEENLLAATRRTRANVLLVGQTAEDERDKYGLLLRGRPNLKVVAIASDGKTGLLYELRPQRVPLGELSADALLKAIRAATMTTHSSPQV